MGWQETLDGLQSGQIRAAEQLDDGNWQVNIKVKKAILEAFRAGVNMDYNGSYIGFVDKHNLAPRKFSKSDGVRMVPGGSSVRAGAYVAPSVIIMPPSYINTGAYVDEGTMVDSNALVGSCAQIGKNVHLSAGVQIGGVLEPVGMNPVIIEDDVFVSAGAIVVEGIIVGRRSVIAPSVSLSRSVRVYDSVNERVLEKGEKIPEGAIVVPGSRPINTSWAKKYGLQSYCPVIIKYRDDKSDKALTLEEALR
ncbi:2,3,4,5-tetrahydropyridine-2,6-dicarboxylate N-succinyltransferase [Francisella halioticida]|uniref:2,3,4,5-tetrahydropyridine-2,6-dicarboxylate N-succinyltransferase n=1 Tax=Francisella halioticida TaxID=549298 RepID=A0ABM6LXF7_9GAMM|nr:2,3,4,5-tetrahydropyridine-2,6-dicarboxylate N-succinyltransferase [Francisella halioticida]ASG67292.1 2,3,4,5-tetrahydropyridine-2,6-dicarboxylate N-succinyltransferase [Francisella halioticida]BCD92448.1 2,3,4,5-tetrahydropyridine-2,6-dicarboxylate N-succinyltransferase [Francisella halioticida]